MMPFPATGLLLLVAAMSCVGQAVGAGGVPLVRGAPDGPGVEPLTIIGRAARRLLGREGDRAADRRAGLAIVGLALGVYVSPPVGLAVAVAMTAWPAVARRRAARRRAELIQREASEVAALYGVALRSGHSVSTASVEMTRIAGGVVLAAIRTCADQASQGRSLAAAFEDLPRQLGDRVRPLSAALVAASRDGAAVADSLFAIAADLRADRRRQAEAAARRTPVLMLFPLVLCILPAFLLLTVVPVVIDALASLDH